MRWDKPNTKIEWRHEYRYREDDRQVFQAEIAHEYPDDEPIPLTQYVAYLKLIWEAIPEEWRQHAMIRLGREGEYDTRAVFEVYLERLEFDEEFAVRKAKERAEEETAAIAQEARERGMLKALKKKYESG